VYFNFFQIPKNTSNRTASPTVSLWFDAGRPQEEEYPLLSCSDITTLLARFLPRRDIHPDEVIRQLEVRHKKRQAAIENAFQNQQFE
jgi:hypothetical protein